VILPQDQGLFVVQGNRVAVIGQSQTTLKTDKKQAAKKILSPIPIIPERHNLEISGKSAAVRLDGSGPDPEFYLRVPYDSAEEPHIQIVRAQIKGENRIVDVIETSPGKVRTCIQKFPFNDGSWPEASTATRLAHRSLPASTRWSRRFRPV
jgi:hypothetical protein